MVALRPFARGELIGEIRGAIVTSDEVWSYWKRNRTIAQNCFRFDADRYLNPAGELGTFANHSCAPNAGVFKVRGRLSFRAITAIGAECEITHDYSTLLGADDIWTMRCDCGEASCRGSVQSFHTLSTALLRRYTRLGVIPSFILATRARSEAKRSS